MVLQIWVAFLLDLIFGDPQGLPHPVVFIGKAIDKAEAFLRKWVVPLSGERAAGVVLTVFIVGATFGLTHLLITVVTSFNSWLGILLQVFILYTSLALKGLYNVAREVFKLLTSKDITAAREKVGWLVGRDTDKMDEAEITRATVESVAENFVDGIISPLFYAFLGGAPLAMAYKAVNTLDSMVGYKNEKYLKLGWSSARLDDLANYIPARIGGYLLLAVGLLTGKNYKKAFQVMIRDAEKHPSPNGGITEAVVSGALGIRLGGFNIYGGEKSFRAYLGDPLYPLEPKKIIESTELVLLGSFLALVIGSLVYYLMEKLIWAVLNNIDQLN